MAATDARPVPRKNVAFRVTFPILDADGDLVASAADLDSEVSKDGGTFADCTNEATQIATNSGIYYLDLEAAEMNADTVAVIVKTSTSGAKTTILVFYPEEVGDYRCDTVQLSGDTIAADNLEAAYDGTGYLPLYHADVHFAVDEANTQDEYTVQWYKNGVPLSSGVTSAQIQVVKRSDGTDHIAATNMTQIASTSRWKHNAATTARLTAGEAVLVIVTATIDAATRTWARIIGRDSSA